MQKNVELLRIKAERENSFFAILTLKTVPNWSSVKVGTVRIEH